MQQITAQHDGPCVVCRQTIMQGEQMVYERARGAWHLACDGQAPARRLNRYKTRCHYCNTRLNVEQGELEVVEAEREDGTFSRKWLAACLDVPACSARCGASLVAGFAPHRRSA